jgi:hypothetical protein
MPSSAITTGSCDIGRTEGSLFGEGAVELGAELGQLSLPGSLGLLGLELGELGTESCQGLLLSLGGDSGLFGEGGRELGSEGGVGVGDGARGLASNFSVSVRIRDSAICSRSISASGDIGSAGSDGFGGLDGFGTGVGGGTRCGVDGGGWYSDIGESSLL